MDPKTLPPDDALDALLPEARAGADDEWLAKTADVSVRQVGLWRKKRGLDQQVPIQQAISALQGLSDQYEPAAHRTDEHFDWEAPEYLLRRPLDYTLYARAVFSLHTTCRFSERQIARATGTRERDVTKALALWRRHLSGHGIRCLGCTALVDPAYGEACSSPCETHATRR